MRRRSRAQGAHAHLHYRRAGAFSAGQLERAEQLATLSLKFPEINPTQVNGPAHKIIGDVRTTQGRFDEAIASHEEARLG